MRRLILFTFSIFILIVIDYAIPIFFPLTSKDNYLLGFENFHNTASETIGQKRIILVGGSSLGWGVSSEVLTKNLGILTLNSGIHAVIGYRNFFRNIEDVLDKDHDLMVISPEYSIVSEGGNLGRSNEFCIIAIYVRGEYPIDCIGYSISSLAKISPILNRNKSASTRDEYIRSGFNKFGDYVHRIEGVNMIGKMDNNDRCFDWKIEDLSEKYVPFVNSIISKRYEVVYIPNFIPSVACHDVDKLNEFHSLMFDKYGIKLFDKAQLLFDVHYFYNSAYHLTEEGVDLKTSIFENQIRHYLDYR
jgi:hypothetical protein